LVENEEISYVNVHTHSALDKSPDVIQISNIFFSDECADIRNTGYYSIGLHPWHIEGVKWKPQKLTEMACNQNVLAIGEVGIDKNIRIPLELQISIFRDQALIAEELQIPLIIHCVKAYDEIISIKKDLKSDVPWVMHGYRGNSQLVSQLIKSGLHISYGHAILNPAPKLHEALRKNSLDKLFLETDDSVVRIQQIYESAADILGLSSDQLKSYLYENFKRVFGRYE
jgi:TatD DNase family protein